MLTPGSGRLFVVALASLGALALVAQADAHTRSQSYSAWHIGEGRVDATFRVSSLEATRLAPAGGDLDAGLTNHLAERLGVYADGEPCRPVSSPRALAAARGYRKVESSWTCRSAGPLSLSVDAFFDIAPSHIHYARVSGQGRTPLDYVFTDAERERAVSEPGHAPSSSEGESLARYFGIGVEHILAGFDHLAFLGVLLLLCRRAGEIVRLVTGFTIGHSISLALAVTGLVEPDVGAIEALIGFTVALAAAENLAVTSLSPRRLAVWATAFLCLLLLLRWVAGTGLPVMTLLGITLFSACYLPLATSQAEAARHRMGVTLMFGLIHGFGFANVLTEVGLPAARLGEALLAFNLGVEFGQIAVVAVLSLGAWLAKPLLESAQRRWLVDASSAALFCVGIYWFVQRGFLS